MAEATTTTTSQSVGWHPDYIRTIPGILKVTECVLCLLTFICAVWWTWAGAGWVDFVAVSGLLSTLVILLLHLLNLISRFPGPWLLIEFIYYCLFTVCFLIAAIVAAFKGGYHPSIAVCSFFAFAATAVYAVDTVFQFRAWRTGQTEMSTTTTTTTSSNAEPTGYRY